MPRRSTGAALVLWRQDIPAVPVFKRAVVLNTSICVDQRGLAPQIKKLAQMNPRSWFSRLKELPSTQLLPENPVFILFGGYWKCLMKEALYSAHFDKKILP